MGNKSLEAEERRFLLDGGLRRSMVVNELSKSELKSETASNLLLLTRSITFKRLFGWYLKSLRVVPEEDSFTISSLSFSLNGSEFCNLLGEVDDDIACQKRDDLE